ncbi:EamA family transporter [Patescibacteria group bacterium]|nr:EamA family transporter [Patescibacteria group bacterium]
MTWIFLSILAALIFTAAYFVDKFFVSTSIKNPYVATVISCAATSLFFSATSLVAGKLVLAVPEILISLAAGIANSLGVLIYYHVMKREEVSRFIPVLSLVPVFTLFFSFLFLGESFSGMVYLGIILIISGSFLISLKKVSHVLKPQATFGLAIITTLLWGMKNALIRLGTSSADVWAVNFWIGIGAGLMALIFFIYRGQPQGKEEKRGAWRLSIAHVFLAPSFIVVTAALARGPAALVSSLIQSKLVFTFFISLFLVKFLPRILRENMQGKVLVQKIVATGLIIGGALLII